MADEEGLSYFRGALAKAKHFLEDFAGPAPIRLGKNFHLALDIGSGRTCFSERDGRCDRLHESLDREHALAAPPSIYRRFSYASAGGDALDRHLVEADGLQEFVCRVENSLPRYFATPSALGGCGWDGCQLPSSPAFPNL